MNQSFPLYKLITMIIFLIESGNPFPCNFCLISSSDLGNYKVLIILSSSRLSQIHEQHVVCWPFSSQLLFSLPKRWGGLGLSSDDGVFIPLATLAFSFLFLLNVSPVFLKSFL